MAGLYHPGHKGGNDEVVHLFLARDLSPSPQKHDREAEEADIRIAWVPLEGTLAVMRTLDAVRERIGVRYPGEAGDLEDLGDFGEGASYAPVS